MPTMNISLPDNLRQFVEGVVNKDGYSTVSEYVRELIRADEKRRAQLRLEELLVEGLESGEPIEVTPEYWRKKRSALLSKHKSKKTGTK
ncbi:MAG TPA: type II toxin-antitoxin system ParD family antitoxin [Blastocatellia bacterium]|nr:type II toxin-antitoxin system ParD family antitoxin [Blastocatellia bacterium]